jgi:hypothetical protein
MENKKRKIKDFSSGFSVRMIGGVILWFLLFTAIVGAIGYNTFTDSLTQEYNDSAFKTAESAAVLPDDTYVGTKAMSVMRTVSATQTTPTNRTVLARRE